MMLGFGERETFGKGNFRDIWRSPGGTLENHVYKYL